MAEIKFNTEIKKPFTWRLMAVFVLFSCVIISMGIYYYRYEKRRIFVEQEKSLAAIASLKIKQISQWYSDKLADAVLIKDNGPLVDRIKEFLTDENQAGLKKEISAWLESLNTQYDYNSVAILDTLLKVRLATSNADPLEDESIRKELNNVIRDHKIIMIDLHKTGTIHNIRMNLLVPLLDPLSQKQKTIGLVILCIDPGRILFPLVQAWPTPSRSSETLILRKEGDSVLYLNELRHRKNTALILKLPVSNVNLLASKALSGLEGVTEGIDYRGISVIGALYRIPGLPWYMVAKTDKQEILQPFKRYSVITVLVIILLILINTLFFGFWIWQQRLKFYRDKIKSEFSIRELEDRFTTAFRMSPVSVTISSMIDNKFIDVNDAFLKDMEYTRDEIIGRTARELDIWADENERLWIINEISEKGRVFGKIISYKTKKGDIIYGLSSMSVVTVNGEPCNLSTVVNITENRKAEEKLRESEELFRNLFENMLNGFAYCKMINEEGHPPDFIYLKVNDSFSELTGLKNVVGKKVSEAIPGIQKADPELLERYSRVAGTRKPEVFEIWVEALKMWFSISVYSPQKGYFVAVFDVITARKLAEEKLNESRSTLQSIINNSNSLIYLTDTAGRFILVNEPLQTLLSPSGEILIGQTREAFLPKEIADIHRKNDLEVITSGKTKIFEEINIEPDGKHFYLTTKFPLFNNQNEVYAVGGLSTDISERRIAEEKLRENESRLREAQNLAHLGFWLWDIKTGNVEWSEEVFKIFCLDPETFKPQINSILELSPWPEENQRDKELISRAIESQNPGTYEQRFMRPDKSIGYYYSTFRGTYDEKGDLISIVGTILDITERKLAEDALRISEDKFKYIFDHSPIGKSVTKPNGEISVNKAFCEITGYPPEELKNMKWQDISHPDDIEMTQSKMNSLVSGERDSVRFEKRYIHKNGNIVWTDVASALRRDHNGNPLYFLTAIIDINDRKNAEETIHRLNEELELKVIQRTELLEAANKELEAFSYSVSHDLRAPLRSVHGFTKILLEDYESKLDNEGKRICGIISSSATRMGELIDDLLSFSRIGRSRLNPSVIDMKKMAKIVYEGITSPAERKRIKLTIGNLPKAFGDVILLGQVWTNLISNAVKYTSKKDISEIKIDSEADDEMITYYIKDNGVGFDNQYANKLFGVFQRLHSETEFEGNGVGLAIVQRIVLKHSGKVWADGDIGKGATFYFSLPLNGSHGNLTDQKIT
jgi:PAS domain S-box-containing protein